MKRSYGRQRQRLLNVAMKDMRSVNQIIQIEEVKKLEIDRDGEIRVR